jgi:hypothetical protein
VSLLRKVGLSGHSVAEAVSELVDNALDARRDDHVSVRVEYDARDGWLRVTDNGRGMNRQELADALVLGLSAKGGYDIGRFGLGLKTAATALGSKFEVHTVREEATYEWVAEYDEAQFVMSGRWELPLRRQRKRRQTGTLVEIRSDRVYATLHQSLHRNLGWTFRHFLRDGVLDLAVNDVPVEPAGYAVDPDSVMPIEGEVSGKLVHGWVGLLHKSSQRGWYGFSMVRHRRILRRHEKLGFQPHPSTARVVGELHLDDFDTNNLKTDFIRETSHWRELETWLSREIEPVLTASRKLAHAGLLDLRVRGAIEEHRERLLGTRDPDEAQRLVTGRIMTREQIHRPVFVAVGPLHLEHVWHRGDPDGDYAANERRARPGESDLVTVRSNLRHPLAAQAPDPSWWACHNIAEVAARALGPADSFTTLKGAVLSKLLGEQHLRRALQPTVALASTR